MNLELTPIWTEPDRVLAHVLQSFLTQDAGLEVFHQDIGAGNGVEVMCRPSAMSLSSCCAVHLHGH